MYVTERNAPAGEPILVEDPGYHQHYPTWSFDEQWIYLVRGRPRTGDTHLWRVRPDGTDAEPLTFDKKYVAYPAPIDEDTVLYVARDSDGSGPWLWVLDLRTGESLRATDGLQQYTSVSASKDGRRVVGTVADPEASLWRIPILEGEDIATEDHAELVDLRTLRALAPRISGDDIFYLSSLGTVDELWRFHDGESEPVWSSAVCIASDICME